MAAFKFTLLVATLGLAVMLGYLMIDRFDKDSLRGKRVLLTGASSGIGEQMAYHYARFGAKMVITGRRESALQKVVKQCQEISHSDEKYHYVIADMAKMAETKHVVQFAVDKLGGLDFIVLNHIYYDPVDFWYGTNTNLSRLDYGFDVNVKSYIHLASHARSHVENSRGSIVVVSSVFGKVSFPFFVPYSSQKFALEGFFNGLRQEFIMRDKDVSVTLAVIGLVATESSVKDFGDKSEGIQRYVQAVQPSDVALAIIKGAALRQREVHYPFWQAVPFTYLRDIWPAPLEYFGRFLAQIMMS